MKRKLLSPEISEFGIEDIDYWKTCRDVGRYVMALRIWLYKFIKKKLKLVFGMIGNKLISLNLSNSGSHEIWRCYFPWFKL